MLEMTLKSFRSAASEPAGRPAAREGAYVRFVYNGALAKRYLNPKDMTPEEIDQLSEQQIDAMFPRMMPAG